MNLHEQIHRIKEMMGLKESNYDGKTLINVDIQPEYKNYLSFDPNDWVEMLNNHRGKIVFLYNGEDTLGMINLHDYQYWLLDHGVDEHVIENATFYDKGYAFFRYCIDEKIEEKQIIDLIKFMIEKDVNDSRDLNEEFWDEFISNYSHDDIRKLLEMSDDCINIPDLMDFLKNYNNIVICGGGANDCLKEVEIALHALGKSFDTYHDFVYEKNYINEEEIQIEKDSNLNTVNENVSQITSGEAVWNHIVSITPDEEDIPWGFEKIIKQNSFIPIDDFDLRSLLTTDPDFKQFYEHNKDNEYFRYDPSEVNSNELDQEIVVVNGELLDGYSRAATKLANGETKTNAFVASKGTIKIDEKVTKNEIICDKCGWKWKKEDGGKDLYICHKCNHNNKPK